MKTKVILLALLLLSCGLIYPSDRFVVVIDAGHGGKDPGAMRGKIKEKDINLGIALALGNLIEENMKDVKVVYTRKTDTFVELIKRSEIANKAKANLFISIHTNSTAAKNTTVSGADTYILGLSRSAENLEVAKRENSVILLEDDYNTKYQGFDPNSPESYIIFEFMANKYMEQSLNFASLIQKEFKSTAKRPDRGVHQAGFLVLRESGMPSVLIEVGFINNTDEVTFLSSKAGQKTMANAIYKGFGQFKNKFDKMEGKLASSATTKEDYSAPPQNAVPKVNTQPSPNGEVTSEFRVQFLYSDRLLPTGSPLFKGLDPVSYYVDNGYKYTYGASKDLQEIVAIQNYVRTKFEDAFVVEFKQVPLQREQPAPPPAKQDDQNRPRNKNTGNISNNNKPASNQIEYRVQFLYSDQKLPDNSPKFKGLSPVSYYEDNGYKYTYGSTNQQGEILRTLKQVKQKFKDAFVIEMKNGKRVK